MAVRDAHNCQYAAASKIMTSLVLWSTCLLTLFGATWCVGEIDFYPGFTRPEPIPKWSKDDSGDDYALSQLAEYLQEKQRLRQLEVEEEEAVREASNKMPRYPEFTYRFPNHPVTPSEERRPFAVDPSDPRYYFKSPVIPDYSGTSDESLEEEENDFIGSSVDKDVSSEQNNKVSEEAYNKYPNDLSSPIMKTLDDYSKQKNGQHFLKNDIPRLERENVRKIKISQADNEELSKEAAGIYIMAIVAGMSAASLVALIGFLVCWYNLHKDSKAAADVEYPAYGVTGPNKEVSPSGDRRLAQSAQMYHYQHQKQQIIAMEKAANERHGSMSEAESDEENEEGDYTVYECPGLAPTGEMEVKNPLFQDDPTPASSVPNGEKSNGDASLVSPANLK